MYDDISKALETKAYRDLDKEHKKLCNWVNELSELTHGYREASEKEIVEVIRNYQNEAAKLIEERDRYKKALEEIRDHDNTNNNETASWEDYYELVFIADKALAKEALKDDNAT